MTTYLLDTSVIIDVLNGKLGRDALLRTLLDQGHLLACCCINITEVYSGMRERERQATEQFLYSLDYYEISREIAAKAGLLKRDWARKGITLSVSDVTIAAVATANGLALITDNARHYPMKEIQIYSFP
ncbi:MAG TPA: PIN domain-containing protein [Acidobacteriota bacterium]|jgi:predicted nucleic acid-binding protein